MTDFETTNALPKSRKERAPRVFSRTASYRDLDRLTLLSRLAFPLGEAIPALRWATYVRRENRIVRVLQRSKEVIGYVSASIRGNEVRLHQVAVAYDYRQRGYGQRLMEDFKNQARKAGCRRATTAVCETHVAAQLFLRSAGFLCYRTVPTCHSKLSTYLFRLDIVE